MAQNLKQLADKINRSLPQISVAVADAEVVGTTTALGDITRRIFNEGKRTDGGKIGTYQSDSYIAKRERAGRQTAFVDLQFTGDLFNSISIGKFNDKPSVGIKSDKENDIANHLEKRFGTVFSASDEERKIALETSREFLFKKLKEIIKTWS